MRRWSLAVAVALMIALSTLVVLPGAAHAAPSGPAAKAGPTTAGHPSVGVITIDTYNGYGYFYTDFYAGETGYNVLYFAIYDPTTDASVNVSLIDNNATRDGIPSPALHVNVPINQTTHWYYSYMAGVSYTFSGNIHTGGGWNISASAPLGGVNNVTVMLHTYFLQITTNPSYGSVLLPGTTVTVYWATRSDGNEAPYSGLANISFFGQYLAGTGNVTPLFGTTGYHNVSTPSAIGSWTFTLPLNATADQEFYFYAIGHVYVGSQLAEAESSGTQYMYVGQPWVYDVYATEAGTTCNYQDHYYGWGDTIQVCALLGARDTATDGFTATAGVTATLTFWAGSTVVTPTSSASSITSNQTGWASFTLTGSAPFSPEWTYPSENFIEFNATDHSATGSGNWTSLYSYWFYLYESNAQGNVQVALNQVTYYSGQTVTATWTVATSNATVGTLTANSWFAYDSGDNLIAEGSITSTASTGTFTVPIPSGFAGEFYVYVDASNATSLFEGEAIGYFVAPTLTINPGSYYYSGGSTVSLKFTDWGAGSATTSIHYTIWAYYGTNLGGTYNEGVAQTGSTTNGSTVSLAVPSTSTPTDYEVEAWLIGSGGQVLATNQIEISESYGYELLIGVQTPSSYSDGSYQPGQAVTFSYSLNTLGGATVPATYNYWVEIYGVNFYQQFTGSGTSGTFQITLPSNLPSGIIFVEMSLTGTFLTGGSCGGNNCYGETAITLNAHPSVLALNLGAGSGLTVGWLILIVIILLVGVLLYVIIRRHRTPPSSPTMSPPAPAPSTPPATEWKGPESSGGSSGSSSSSNPSPPPGAQ